MTTSFLKRRISRILGALVLLSSLAATGAADLKSSPDGFISIPANLGAVAKFANLDEQVLAIKADGSVAAFSIWNGYAARGLPFAIPNAKVVGLGSKHSVVLKSDGSVVAWGDNTYGQCNANGQTNVKDMQATAYATILLRNDGSVLEYGYDFGDGVPSGLQATSISTARFYAAAVRADGSVAVWGDLQYGVADVPPGLAHVVKVDAGESHVLAIKDDGSVVAWGKNDHGECDVPAGLDNVVSVEAGEWASFATRADGSVVFWGDNTYGAKPTYGGYIAQISNLITFSLYIANEPTITASDVVGGSVNPLVVKAGIQVPRAFDTSIALTSSSPAVPLPPTVTVPAGATIVSLPIPHNIVTSTVTADLSATARVVSAFDTVHIRPFEVSLLNFDGDAKEAGTLNAILKLNASPRENLSVPLTCSDNSYISLPSAATVRSKNNFVSFPITTSEVPNRWTTTITAGWAHSSKEAKLTVLPAPRVKSFKLQASTMNGNQTIQAVITLNRPAGENGAVVETTSNNPAAMVPPSVYFAAGETTASFDIRSTDVSETISVQLSAATTFSAIGKTLEVHPMLVKGLSFDKATLTSGESATLMVTLGGVVSRDTLVDLSTAFPGFLSVPAFVIVPAGSSSRAVTVTANSVSITRLVGVSAGRLGKHQTAKITVSP